jgi:hypothetical protein
MAEPRVVVEMKGEMAAATTVAAVVAAAEAVEEAEGAPSMVAEVAAVEGRRVEAAFEGRRVEAAFEVATWLQVL